jgi:hypothetical protein
MKNAYDSSTFVSKNNWECALKKTTPFITLARATKIDLHTSGSAPLRVYSSVWQIPYVGINNK